MKKSCWLLAPSDLPYALEPCIPCQRLERCPTGPAVGLSSGYSPLSHPTHFLYDKEKLEPFRHLNQTRERKRLWKEDTGGQDPGEPHPPAAGRPLCTRCSPVSTLASLGRGLNLPSLALILGL